MDEKKQNLRFTFRKYERISRKKEINFVLSNGKKFFQEGLIVYLYKKEQKHSRLAILVSRKIEKSAVLRNKFKRRIREIFRLNKHKINCTFDIIVVATKISIRQKYKILEKNFLKILESEGCLINN